MYKVMDGNKACSTAAYLFSEICSVYPITPSSPMASNIDLLSNKDTKNLYNNKVKIVEMQSEAGAIATMHGALISGSLASTFTSSQGLLLMIPNMYKIAGEMLPGVIHCAARTVATHALSIFGDHSDIYATRQTGFCMLSSTNVEDAYYLGCIAHLSSIKGSLPFLHFFDGFRTSHEINKVDIIDETEILKLIDYDCVDSFRSKSLIGKDKIQKGLAENEDIYFQSLEARNTDYNNMPDIVNSYMEKINKLTNKDYKPFNYYGSENATNVIVAMGSVCDTIKLVVNKLSNVGLIEVHLYRPFSKKYLLNVLPSTVKNIAVLDKTKEAGSSGEPLYLDVLSSLKDTNINIVGGRYGLSSKDTTPDQINAVYEMLNNELKDNFTIGINDDVTNLSLDDKKIDIDINCDELLIYGFGSDGMVSASKDFLNIIGNTNKFVQGYFEYDSKKSGGVTKSHLRISDNSINAPYYVTNPQVVVITKDSYVYKYKLIDNIKDNGIVILNTSKNENELDEFLPNEFKKVLMDKNVKLYIIDAEGLSNKNNIGNKISKIIETILLKMININNYEELIIESINKQFSNKGIEIVNGNINAIKDALKELKEVNINFTIVETKKELLNVIEMINKREGNSLKVSDLIEYRNGSFPCGLSKHEKRNVSSIVAKWDKEKCINCGLCSINCPHAVIRMKDDNNLIVSSRDCTGCGVCVSVCPTKALSLVPFDSGMLKDEELIEKENAFVENPFTIKTSQFNKPLFEFSGACAGCGETPYLKLLTQLFGEKLIIANATGCSSIYGGSAPSTPYSIPWANSLFEDNAEFALGMLESIKEKRNNIKNIIASSIDSVSESVKIDYEKWLNNSEDYNITNDIKKSLENKLIPNDLKKLINYIPTKSVWAVGGDGWAYDIGFGGLDHVLSSNEDINILVLDTEVYSNTGGQMSKSSRIGQVSEFANLGKRNNKKDLFKIACNYPNVYVASVSLGANPMQTIKAFKEAESHKGPSLIIAYSPCVEHGIKKGLSNSVNEQKLAVKCGYVLLLRYLDNKLYLDSSTPDFDMYEEFLLNEVRYNSLKIKDENLANELLNINKNNAIDRYNYYKELSNK